MKNFDLEAAKVGAPVCTRSGKPVRIICWDMKWKSGKLGDRIVYLTNYSGDEHISSCLSNGAYHGEINDSLDLMMRDDDYAEKLARGEYGNHIDEATEKVDPVVKENLTTDREYWRRVYAEQMMAAAFPVLVSTDWHAKDEYANIPGETLIARQAIALADALLEELEKTEKKL